MSALPLNLETALCSMARDLHLLVKVSTTINTTKSLKALQTQLLESMFEAIPAERAAIMLIDDIPFKSNSKAQTSYGPKSTLWETTFHMIKAKFGQRLRSKTLTAQINEALCKVLCHNLCVVIQSVHGVRDRNKLFKRGSGVKFAGVG